MVTYIENLEDGNGIEAGEMVSEQAGVHEVTSDEMTHSNMSVELYGPGNGQYHSNVHIGELHWRDVDNSEPGDPNDPGVTPSPQLKVEVDWYEQADPLALQLLDDAEQNFALYGINVTYDLSEEISRNQLERSPVEWDDELPPHSTDDLDEIEEAHHTTRRRGFNPVGHDSVYLFLSTVGGDDLNPATPNLAGADGAASSSGRGNPIYDFGIVVFTEDRSLIPKREGVFKTIVHETSHPIGAGLEDDENIFGFSDEVYSGESDDDTPERISYPGSSNISANWSVMSSGIRWPARRPPMDGDYFAFSIEELSTVETHRVIRETHGLLGY